MEPGHLRFPLLQPGSSTRHNICSHTIRLFIIRSRSHHHTIRLFITRTLPRLHTRRSITFITIIIQGLCMRTDRTLLDCMA